MSDKIGENIRREWDSDPRAPEVWDALQLFDTDATFALADLTELAESGSPLAMLYLGAAYFNGRGGIEPDPKLGEHWTERSARAGSVEGAFGLACHYDAAGRFAEAEAELVALADRGYSPAMFRLGWSYYTGRWGRKYLPFALHYLVMAERAGHLHATHWLSTIYRKETLGLAKKIAGYWKKLAILPSWVSHCVNYPTSDRLRLGANPNQMADLMKRCVEPR